ncbi:MAG: methionine synthase [Deltaproteobacteria bacterium]|nr:methionine synthase [Deltaproteobacteria bacterium]
MILPTTSVGSFPKPEYLTRARTRYARREITRDQLEALERQATEEWIRFQEEIGIDILVDGEMYRGDMCTYFAENMRGFRVSGLVRAYGNRFYKKPVAVARVEYETPITVEWFKFARARTARPVKGMITGPYTMMDWSFNEHYPSRRAFALDLARALHDECLALQEAGAPYIQLDEPALSTKVDEMPLAIELTGIVTDGLRARTIMHICYGAFEKVYPAMLDIPVDQLDLEMANSHFDLLDLFRTKPFTKEIGLGVIDVHTHEVEPQDRIEEWLRRTLQVIPKERVYVDPDCGLKTRTVEEAQAKLRVMVDAVRAVRREIGG